MIHELSHWNPRYLEYQMPATMAALRIGNDVYYASGIKKGFGVNAESFIYDIAIPEANTQQPTARNTLLSYLMLCQTLGRGGHVNVGGCAEVMALYKYFLKNPGAAFNTGGTMVTWGVPDVSLLKQHRIGNDKLTFGSSSQTFHEPTQALRRS
jgi:hypothetical protein